MPTTPKHLLDLLNSITAPQAPTRKIESLHAHQVKKIRNVFEDPNIVGVGVSRKVSDQQEHDELCVTFYVERKLPPGKVTGKHFVPPIMRTSQGRSVYTDVKQIGRVVPQVKALVERKPIESGFSVGHVKITAGTVGAIVMRSGKLFLLSNSHVLANSGKGKAGDKIVYPGPADGGENPADWIAVLTEAVPFKKGGEFVNEVDAALAEVRAERSGDLAFKINASKTPLGTIAPQRDMLVTKKGRTTGVTKARILDVDFRIQLTYEGVGKIGFTNQVLCERYTDGGDSGSLVVDVATGKIVGLHFAGASGGSVFNPIAFVIKALKFKFASS